MRTHVKTLRKHLHKITALGNLTHGVAFEIVTEITFAHDGLFASNVREEGVCESRGLFNRDDG